MNWSFLQKLGVIAAFFVLIVNSVWGIDPPITKDNPDRAASQFVYSTVTFKMADNHQRADSTIRPETSLLSEGDDQIAVTYEILPCNRKKFSYSFNTIAPQVTMYRSIQSFMSITNLTYEGSATGNRTVSFYLNVDCSASPGLWPVTWILDFSPYSPGAMLYSYDISTGTPVTLTADFSGSPTSGIQPLTVTFADATTGPASTYSWNFGDGQTSTARNPVHVYQNAGTYSVSLNVAGSSLTSSKVRKIGRASCRERV